MSITDEDLQYMADAMWDDTLLPGIEGDLGLGQLLSADEHVEGTANESDVLLKRRSKSKTPKSAKMVKTTTATTAQKLAGKDKASINWKRSAKPASGSATATPMAREQNENIENNTATKTKAKPDSKSNCKVNTGGKRDKSGRNTENAANSRDRTRMPPPQRTSPLSDLYLSSLPDTLTKPKVNGKLSKSMKGASQNEMQAPEADMLSASDPYGVPTSPASKHLNHGKPAQNAKATSPVMSVAKMASPLGLIPASDKKHLKPQKRVAKRSFLDAPETPEKETNVTPAPVKPLQAKSPPAKPPPKAAANPKRKPPVSKGKGKGKEKQVEKQKEEEVEKPVQRPRYTKTIVKAEKEEKLTPRSFLVPKSEKDEDSPYDIPASVLGMPPTEEITKKLRPRTGKPAIIISSDSETSYSDDDSASFAGNTTVMTTPDHAAEDVDLAKHKPQKTEVPAITPSGTMGQMIFGRSSKRPAEEAATKTTNRPKKLQRQVSVDAKQLMTDHAVNDATSASYGAKAVTEELYNVRGPEALVSEQYLVEQVRSHEKRQRSPTRAGRTDYQSKRPKLERRLSTHQGHDDEGAADEYGQMQFQGSSSKVVHSVAASDPFVGDSDEERPQKSQFTSKLLRSAVEPTSDMEQWEYSRGASRQPQFSMAVSTPCPGRDVLVSHKGHASHAPQGVSANSNQIAQEMMQLLQSSRRVEASQGQKTQIESAKDIWLDETDPYKETTQVMGYVCKTLLRFLKSKEAAIEDVATEFRQRGSAILARIKELHGNEKNKFGLELEDKRQKSLELFEEASHGVRKIAGSLERVSLVPAINDVLTDNTISRLRALQAEVA